MGWTGEPAYQTAAAALLAKLLEGKDKHSKGLIDNLLTNPVESPKINPSSKTTTYKQGEISPRLPENHLFCIQTFRGHHPDFWEKLAKGKARQDADSD
eukprot:1372079-Amorphochlora_amoeboformis.AAC.1